MKRDINIEISFINSIKQRLFMEIQRAERIDPVNNMALYNEALIKARKTNKSLLMAIEIVKRDFPEEDFNISLPQSNILHTEFVPPSVLSNPEIS